MTGVGAGVSVGADIGVGAGCRASFWRGLFPTWASSTQDIHPLVKRCPSSPSLLVMGSSTSLSHPF